MNPSQLNPGSSADSRRLAVLLATLAVAPALWAQAPSGAVAYAPPTARVAVGEVTFAVGPTVRVSAEGVPEVVHRGTKILPGDRLDTAEGGLLHVRFMDGALVSLRPGSRLWVEEYRYDPVQVNQSAVRFRLDHGVARAISGAAAEGAKERFRLNTPLVAIGVRGTDFVVRSDDYGTTATVNQGAIVMAPFSAGCPAQGLGPCNSPTARLLTADMGQLLVEYQPRSPQPEIRPQHAASLVLAGGNAAAPAAGPSGIASDPITGSAENDVIASAVVRQLSSRPASLSETDTAAASIPEPAPVVPVPVTQTPPPIVVEPSTPVPVPDPSVPLVPPQLAWGRWSAEVSGDISLTMDEARKGRRSTVGDASYVLYRAPSTGNGELARDLGAFQFSLQQSQARYTVAGQVQPATVESGRLDIDFGTRRFSTSLNVSSAATGIVGINGAGTVRPDGVFVDRRTSGQAIAGAVAFDAKSAGYLFEKSVGTGQLSGITLWSRP